ncbi:hypothetical protein P3S67_001758 [Capsicum chacoense]
MSLPRLILHPQRLTLIIKSISILFYPLVRTTATTTTMATPFSCFCSAPVQSSSSALSANRVNPGQKPTTSWWTPLFGWSSEPDYIAAPRREISGQKSDSKFQPGCFTEDKAKELRRKTMETSNFHDIMYHSAIASRLASDVSPR